MRRVVLQSVVFTFSFIHFAHWFLSLFRLLCSLYLFIITTDCKFRMFWVLWMRSFAVIACILGSRDEGNELAIRGHRNSWIFRGLTLAFCSRFVLIYSLYFLYIASPNCLVSSYCSLGRKIVFFSFLGGYETSGSLPQVNYQIIDYNRLIVRRSCRAVERQNFYDSQH